jgi:hypothetical protein
MVNTAEGEGGRAEANVTSAIKRITSATKTTYTTFEEGKICLLHPS